MKRGSYIYLVIITFFVSGCGFSETVLVDETANSGVVFKMSNSAKIDLVISDDQVQTPKRHLNELTVRLSPGKYPYNIVAISQYGATYQKADTILVGKDRFETVLIPNPENGTARALSFAAAIAVGLLVPYYINRQ